MRYPVPPEDGLVTTPDQLREIVRYLQDRVRLATDDNRAIVFDPPDADRMISDGLEAEAARSIVSAPWWSEMVDDIIETPDFAEPDDSPDVVLGYARDLVREYVSKRFDLQG